MNAEPEQRVAGRLRLGPSLAGLGYRASTVRHPGRALIWLVFLAFPFAQALDSRDSGFAKVAVIAGAAVFLVVFVGVVRIGEKPLPAFEGVSWIAMMLGVAIALTLADRSSWVTLVIYTSSACAVVLPPRLAMPGVLLCTAVVAATQLIDHSPAGGVFGYTTSTAGVGMLMLALADLRARNRELSDARAELAQLAVARERERFARDMHDLLGHTLSVIALKAELAGRLIPRQPGDAAREIGEVQDVARKALGEVREAVSGYRRPTLDDELAGARMALSAAGVQTEIQRASVAFDPDVEGALAWAIREGATNVIRHSGAHRCAITIEAGLDGALVEVRDDGVGERPRANGDGLASGLASSGASGGHGLAGLAERAAGLGGRLAAGPCPDGGFRLAVTVPLRPVS